MRLPKIAMCLFKIAMRVRSLFLIGDSTRSMAQPTPQEPILPVTDIQGDCILGFNKPFNVRLIFNIKDGNDSVDLTKAWLKDVPLTSTKDIKLHRQNRSQAADKSSVFCAFTNISFSFNCLKTLLTGTDYEASLKKFNPLSAFALGSSIRSSLLGYTTTVTQWDTPDVTADTRPNSKGSGDILYNIFADNYDELKRECDKILRETGDFLEVVNQTWGYRGVPGQMMYGHEHFGFLDGLSNPEVRGCEKDNEDGSTSFIVARKLDPNSPLSADYSRPGFRLLDTGHFILGYQDSITDTNDAEMDPQPSQFPPQVHQYPSWCDNGSFVVYNKLEQDVTGFWKDLYLQAQSLLVPDAPEEDVKNLTGELAANCFGRWWDGTPLLFRKSSDNPAQPPTRTPISGYYYPPSVDHTMDSGGSLSDPFHPLGQGLINGFLFDEDQPSWPLTNPALPPAHTSYKGDYLGQVCPMGAHIRKVNPRDEFTDIGSDVQTLRHRMIRRGINYFDGDFTAVNTDPWFDRVKDVFDFSKSGPKRGLSLVTYQSSIDEQFEFLQRHWANSASRPKSSTKSPGNPSGNSNDMVIGQCAGTRFLPVNAQSLISVDRRLLRDPSMSTLTISFDHKYVIPVGLGYFLLPPISTVRDVLTAPLCEQCPIYQTPAYLRDFTKQTSYEDWSKFINFQFWSAIWVPANQMYQYTSLFPPPLSTMKYGTGVAYRLHDLEDVEKIFDHAEKGQQGYLQFRSPHDLAVLAGGVSNLTEAKISWSGFPKIMKTLYTNTNTNPYEAVEVLGFNSQFPLSRKMDEYCEWFSHRNTSGQITRIDITAEPPEYYQFIFQREPETGLQLYKQFVSPLVKMEDLVDSSGNYNMYNKWNTTHGAMHLNCPPNSLSAEIYIAAEACNLWMKTQATPEETLENPIIATTGGDLITSGQYGRPTRSSDPTIGSDCNALARNQFTVSLKNPVGLYMETLDTTGWLKPDGTPFTVEEIKQMVTYHRGDAASDRWVRISIEVPVAWNFVLGDCTIGGVPLQWAGQIIDASVTVFLIGVAAGGLVPNDFDSSARLVPPKSLWNNDTIGPKYTFNSPIAPPQLSTDTVNGASVARTSR
jgi:deferrochelatase/peroxidase EfeB